MSHNRVEAVGDQYKAVVQKQGLRLEIEYRPGLSGVQGIEENERQFTVKLDSDRIGEADFEEYLSYYIRKIILPCLRLETGRLVLRRFEMDDAQAYFSFFSDKDDAYMDEGTIFTAMDEEYDKLMASYAKQTRYSILQKGTGHIIGTINLMDINDRAVETMEIGYAIAPGYKRRGYAYEALSALLNYLLHDLNLDMVIAGAFPDNIPSLRLIEKLGFQYEGLKHKAFWNHMRGAMDLKYYFLEKPLLDQT